MGKHCVNNLEHADSPTLPFGDSQVQTYANLCLLAALGFYSFTDAKMVGKGAKYLAIVAVAAFVVTEGIALIA